MSVPKLYNKLVIVDKYKCCLLLDDRRCTHHQLSKMHFRLPFIFFKYQFSIQYTMNMNNIQPFSRRICYQLIVVFVINLLCFFFINGLAVC